MEGRNIKKPKSNLSTEDNSVELALEQFRYICGDYKNCTKKLMIFNWYRNETLEIILQNGFLIPNVEQLESIGIVVEGMIWIKRDWTKKRINSK